MNKTAIQKFAIWARTELIEQVAQRAYQYGIDANGYGDATAESIGGKLLTAEEKAQRCELIQQIDAKGYEQVMEEVAYTWFNRFIALRFMEVNNYLPSHIRVFSDASGAFKPEILSDVLHLELPGLDTGKVAEYIENNDTEGLYRYLLLTQCNALNESLPRMFERMGGYTEMLLPNNILKPDSVLGRMVSDIPEEDWQDAVQIIGWLYQYYNTELKDDTFARLKKNVKITKERIPAATQLFTPDWIVRYMVENSLGRLWVEGHPNDALKSGWKYYLDEAKQEPEVEAQLTKLRAEYAAIKPEEIKVIDPCMGSGHILVYAFDVLMQIYTSAGWSEREAAQSILKNNLYGLDIDDRAAQLAYFAVMMKARQYDRRLLTRGIQPNVYAIHESNHIPSMAIEYFHQGDARLKTDIERLVTAMRDAKEYGSILNVAPVDFARLYIRFEEICDEIHMMQPVVMNELLPMVQCAELLARKYDVVVTNPPYMSSGNMNAKLLSIIKGKYDIAKNDTYSVFIIRCRSFTRRNGFYSMITMQGWMFTQRFEELRLLLLQDALCSMLHVGYNSFPELNSKIAQGTAFSFRKCRITKYVSKYFDLTNHIPQSANKQKVFETKLLQNDSIAIMNEKFRNLPGNQFAYWVTSALLDDFITGKKLGDVAAPRQGLATGDNETFLRMWFEVEHSKLGFGCASISEFHNSLKKYAPYNKGGDYCKWYGNRELVIKFDSENYIILQAQGNHLPSKQYYFAECATWSALTTSGFSCRYCEHGFVFDTKGSSLFCKDNATLQTYMGFLNCIVANEIFKMLSPTVDYNAGTVANVPILEENNEDVTRNVSENIELAKYDWDVFEISWDFKRNPLI